MFFFNNGLKIEFVYILLAIHLTLHAKKGKVYILWLIDLSMRTAKLMKVAQELEGIYTVDTLCKRLDIGRTRAIYLIHRLRKVGMIKTTYVAGNKRLYFISISNKLKGISFTDKINEATTNQGIHLSGANIHFIHGREPSYEEALVYALKQDSVRYIIASLGLFRKIKDWSSLYSLARKEENSFVRKIAALYDVSRLFVKKVRKMPKRFVNLAMKEKDNGWVYVIDKLYSRDFENIEKRWKVHIPLNWGDLEEYKR